MNQEYKSFSERNGYRQPKLIQREEIDDISRNGLWGVFYDYFPRFTLERVIIPGVARYQPHIIYRKIWTDFLHQHSDQFGHYDERTDFVKELFLSANWNIVFDLIEFCLQKMESLENSESETYARVIRQKTFGIDFSNSGFEQLCNQVLAKENSAYQIIGGSVTEITSEEEIQTVEQAIDVPFEGARGHIYQSLALLTDRENPDYRNSIKESISAVESLAKSVTGEDQGTLGQLTDGLNLHPAFSEGLAKLYGFTSDADGIRHGSSGKPLAAEPLAADQNTARFMLVICSAFVNYIISRNE